MASRTRTIGKILFVVVAAVALAARDGRAGEADAFEKEIRPLLIDRCGKCHGAEKSKGGLRLDARRSVIEGGETGPAVVPGRPEESLLIAAVRRTGDLKMPPDRPLNAEQVAALERWVTSGAPWPESQGPTKPKKTNHWAFLPVGDPKPPAVRDETGWCRNPIDAFILARLEGAGLSPSPKADRRTLIRRASYDLTGLPPSPAEVEAFVGDADPAAYERLVDRLLASPAHGEQWARHWLDVARYSDTKGYVYAREERFFVHAPTYRDWVVRAFNDDLPYDRFVRLQVAADLETPGDRRDLAALGFLTLGRRFLGVSHDIIDDRIDVVTRGTMGLTVACARCHDHKFDPIPTADYYALYGVFQNTTEHAVPVGEPPTRGPEYQAFEKELAKRSKALDDSLAANRAEASKLARTRLAEYLMAQRDLKAFPEEGFDVVLSRADLIPAFVRRWESYLAASSRSGDPVFRPWNLLANLTDEGFPAKAAAVVRDFQRAGSPAVNPLVAKAFAEPPASIREAAGRYGKLFAEVDRRWRELTDAAKRDGTTPPDRLPDPDAETLRRVLYGPGAPSEVPDEGIIGTETYFDSRTCEALWKLQGEVDRWLIQSPTAPAYAGALADREALREPRVFRRGNPANKGDFVPRRFPTAVAGPESPPFARGSGRQELAKAITAADNPLTARVWANRVWLHHFGTGLVRTPSDFGLRAEAPTHPELLDWLARRLTSGGWSTKDLHRLIVLSAAYQQRSDVADVGRERAVKVDPENRLLWRMNPRRLAFEELRDTLLFVTGGLDRRAGGRAADLFPAAPAPANARRTIYGLVDRQFPSPVFRLFDFANPDLHTPQRSETTVPQQALFALNHPFVADRARALVARLSAGEPPEAKVRQLFRSVYQRDPTAAQSRAALAFLDAVGSEKRTPAPPLDPWGQLAQVLLMANELMFVD